MLKNAKIIVYATSLLALIVLIGLSSCRKVEDDVTPSIPKFVDKIDSFNFIIAEGDTFYHRIVKEVTFKNEWLNGFNVRNVSWWNQEDYHGVYFYLSTNSGSYGHFSVNIDKKDSTTLYGNNNSDNAPISWVTLKNKHNGFTFKNVRIYPNYPEDTSSYFLLSGQCYY